MKKIETIAMLPSLSLSLSPSARSLALVRTPPLPFYPRIPREFLMHRRSRGRKKANRSNFTLFQRAEKDRHEKSSRPLRSMAATLLLSLALPLSLSQQTAPATQQKLTSTPPLSADLKRPVYLASEEWVQRDSHPASSASWRSGAAPTAARVGGPASLFSAGSYPA